MAKSWLGCWRFHSQNVASPEVDGKVSYQLSMFRLYWQSRLRVYFSMGCNASAVPAATSSVANRLGVFAYRNVWYSSLSKFTMGSMQRYILDAWGNEWVFWRLGRGHRRWDDKMVVTLTYLPSPIAESHHARALGKGPRLLFECSKNRLGHRGNP